MADTNDNISKLHQALKNQGYNDIGSEDEFRTFVSNNDNVKKLHQVLKDAGFNDIGSEDEFGQWLGASATPSVPAGDATGTAASGDVATQSQQTEQQRVENAPTFEVADNGYTFTEDELQKMEEGQRPVMKPKYGTPEYGSQKIEGDASNPYAGMTRQQAINAVGSKFFNEWYGKGFTPETTKEVDGEKVTYGGLGAYDQIRAELAAYGIVAPEHYANVTKDIRRAYIQPVARRRVEQLMSNFKAANHQNIDDIQGVFDSREAQQAINQDLERLGFAPTPEAYDGDEAAMRRDAQRYEQARQYYYQQLENELENILVDKYGWLPSSDARSDVGGFRNEILSGGGKEHEERIKFREYENRIGEQFANAIDQAFTKADERGDEAEKNATRTINTGNTAGVASPTAMQGAMLGQSMYATKKGNEERDPDKILNKLLEAAQTPALQLIEDPQMLEEVWKDANAKGMDINDYIDQYVAPSIRRGITRRFEQEAVKRELPKSDTEYVLRGLEESLVGMLVSRMVNTESQQRYKNMANAQYGEDAGLLTNALRTTVGFVADAPMWAAWGSVGGAVAKRQIAEYMLREASRRGVSLQVMQRAMAESANHYLGAAVGQRLMQGVPQMAITMGGAQATSELARGIRDREELGEILKNTLGTAVTEGVKGGAIGAFTGVAHPYVDRLSGIGKVAGKVGSFAGEAGVFYTAGELEKLAKGEDAFGNPLEGLAESALNLALIKLTNMDNIKRYADAFMHPKKALEAKKGELTDEDVDMIRANADGAKFIDAITSMRPARTVPGAGEREGNLSTEEINAGAEAYRKMMVNPDIPFATKQKVARIVDGILPPPGKAVELDIEDGPSGESVLRTRDIDGQLLEEHRYDSREEADKAADAMRGELFANTTEALEGKVNSTDAYRRFTEYFENAYREASEKILRGEELTKAEQQAIYLHQHQDELLDIYKNVESGEELSEGGQSLADLYRQHFEGFVNSGRALKEFTDAYERDHGLEPGSLHKALEKDVRTEEEVQMLLDYQEAMRQHVAEARDGDRIAEQETKDAEEADFEDVTGQRMLENSAPGNNNPAGVVFENGGAPSGGSGPGGSVDTAGGEAGANSGTGANDPSAAPSVTQRREAAYQRGAAAVQDTSTLPQVNYDLKLSIARMEQLFPSSDPVLSRLRSDVIKAVEAGDDAEADRLISSNSGILNDSQREAIEQYRDMMETSRGLDDAITQQAQEYEQQRRAALEPLAAPDGSITELTLSDGSKAYYLAGNLNNTLGGVMIVTESGERKQIPVSQIKSVGERQMVSDVVSADVNSFAAQLEQQIEGLANGGDFTPGSQVDLMIAGRAFRATVAGKDGAGNILFTMEDGSQVPMSGNDARRAVYDADKAKIEAQLKQEADDAIAQQKAERFGKSIVGYAEGTPDLTAEGSDPKAVAEYLESRQDEQQLTEAEKAKHHAAVMSSIESETERTGNQAEQAAETVRRLENKAAIDSLSEEETAALNDARASLADARKRRRKWGEIRQALMTDEERRKFEADRQKEIRKAQTAVGGNEIAGQQTKEATGALPTGQELMEQFAEQGDAVKYVDSLREELKIQHRDKVFPQLSAARDAVNDYRRGLTDGSEAELRDMMARLANLEAEESAMVVRQQELGKLASSLGRLYAARNKAAMSPHERMMAAMEKESDPSKKIKLAREAYRDDEEALAMLDQSTLEPQDVYEWIAANLGKGSINWEGLQRGEHYVRGLIDWFGRDKKRGIGKQYDTNAINYFLAPEGQGKGIDEVVHAIAEGSPYDDTVVANALDEMLRSASKPTDITNRIVDDRIARADEVYEANLERARDAEEEARREAEDAAIMQMTGMTPEEYDAFMGDLEQRLAEQEGYRTSEEYFNQLAEDNDRENERRAGGSQEAGALAEQGQEGEPGGATPAGERGTGEADVIAELSEPAQSDAADASKPQAPNENGGESINAETQTSSSAGKDAKNVSKEEKSFSSRLAEAKEAVNVSPTDAQKEAGNYKKGHVSFGGYEYTIENPKGSVRSGVDRSGKPWSTTMQDTYGYILGKYGHDGDHIDMFINDDADLDSWNGRVFVVDQKSEDGSFDEHKVMYGYANWKEAKEAYERNYQAGWWDSHVIQMMGVRKADFDKWLEDSDHKTKPFADYVRTKNGDPIRDNVDQLIADVRERVRHLPTWDANEIEGMERERLTQLLKKRQKDLSVSRYLLKAAGVEGSGSAKEMLLNNNIAKAEADIKALEAEQRRRIELREIGDAMVDNLEAMGFDVSTDPSENRRVRKKAEKDQSEEGKMRHFETPSGDIYGFTYRGKMYLDPTKIDAELPVHEYAHPWCEAFRRLNPEGWKGIVGLMKGDKDTWEFVKSVNPDLKSEDDIAEEMIAKFSGKKGAERAEAEYRRMNGIDSDYKSKWGNIWKNISKAIQDFWKQMGDFLHIKYTSAEQVYDQVLRDFANKINPRKRVEEWLRERDERYLQAVGNSDTSTAKELFDQALRENIGNGITPFVAVAGYRGKLQNLARGIKNRDPRVVSSVADLMAPLIPKDAVLVPAPSHKGTATDMLDLAQALSERSGAPVADVLRGSERGSQYEAKKAGRPLSVDELGIKATDKLPDGKLPVVIDNVVDTGSTAEACVRALGKGIVVSLADSADRYKHVASLKSAEPVVTDKTGKVVPLSKRFELGGRYLEKAGTVNDMAMESDANDMATEASIVSMPRINQFGLNENDPVGRTLTGIKQANGEGTLAAFFDTNGKAFLFMGKDAGAVRRDAYRKGMLEMVDGVERLSVPETELDLVLPILVRKGYKVGIADKITEGQPKVKVRTSPVKSIVQTELFSDKDFEAAGAAAIELPNNGRSDGLTSMSDEALLKAIGENEERERGFHIDEYDKRHRQEYNEVMDAYSQMLEENDTSLEDAYSMYSDTKKHWADQGGYATTERTQLLAQIDVLEAYIEQKEAERMERESDEEEARLEQERKEAEQQYQQLKEEVRAKGYDLTQLKLRPLEEGETSHVQRRYQENGMFSFTGSEYIESIDDVAFIFKELEDAAVENTFMVLEKDGVPTIIHLAIGSYDAAHAPVEQSLAAFKAIDPDKVWFVHNHPSGNLKSSRQDKDLMRKFHSIFGDKLQDGIIIDTKSGRYGVFQESVDLMSREMPSAKRDAMPMKVYSFSKQVFAPDWNPEKAFSVMSAESIAEFVSSHRLGEHDKMSLIVLDQAGHVTGNVFLPWTAMADAATQQGADLIASYVQQMGGNRVVIYGNYRYEGTKTEKYSVKRLNDMLRNRNVRTQDIIHIDRSAYLMGDIAGEPTASEAHDAVDAMLDEVERRKVLAAGSVFVSNAMKAVEGIKQEKATPEQWLAMIQKAGGLKAGEDKWIGLSDWLKDQKGSVTKQEVMDFIRANQIRVEEVHYGEDQTEEWAILDAFNEEFFILQEDAYEDNPDIDADEQIRYAWDEMCRRYGASGLHGFNNAFRVDDYGRLEIDDFDEAVALANKYKGMNASRPVNDTRLSYTTKGLKNKREIALVVPTVEPWNESDEVHFGDAGNGRAVAWVRFGETTDKYGKRVLVIDEIQSKRHQEGRENGYKTKESIEEEERLGEAVNKAQDAYDAYTRKMGAKYDGAYEDIYPEMTDAEQAEADRLEQDVYSASEKLQNHYISDIPDAPFEKNWHELAMKRMLRYAAENGYDKVAWTKGEQQSKRYDLSKSFSFISYDKDTKKLLAGTLKDGVIDYNFDSIEKKVEPNNLSEYVGKDLAQRLLDNGVIQDEEIHIGGEGMKGFYDQMLPRFMDKYGKKWGVKTGEVDLPDVEPSARKMWAVDVTPEMKESVMQGQPMFRRGNARVEKVNTQFNEDLEKLKKGELPSGHVFEMGMPSIPLLSAGIPYAPIRLHSNVLNTKMHDPAHTFTPDEIKDLVKHIQRPIAIFEYGDKEKAQNLMVGIQQATTPEGKQFLVGLALEPVVNGKKLEYNSVRNVFPKNFHDWIHWINQGKLLRVDDKKEIEAIIDALRINPVDYISNDDLNSAAKIVKDFENPKLSDEKIREIYPEYTEVGDETAELLGGEQVVWEQQTLEPGTKGWYNPNDNTVHVAIDEVESADDVRRTVCHEKLGHEGLSALMGGQDEVNKFGTFIFKNASKKLRQRILEKADEEGYEWNDPLRLSKASQEVFADIAADGPRTADEFSLWDKVKHYIIKLAKKIGLKVRGLLNDHDLSYYVLKTGEALKRWNKMSDAQKAVVASQETEYDIMRRRRGKPRKKNDESMAQYLQRLREWEKWKIAEETSIANGDPMPDKADIDNEWSEKFEADMNEWKSRNNIATDGTGPGSFPKRGENETPQEYAIRVAEYETQADVWRGAPNYFDYMQKAQDEYRRRYDEWKRRYDLQEAENVDMAVYEGEGGEGPQTFEDEEAEILAERDMAEAFGVQVDSEGAKRHAKLAVINRRKNLESSNADDAIWLHDFIKKTEELAALMQQQTGQQVTGKMLREALPFIIEGTYWEEALKDEDGNVIGFADISDQLPIKKSPELDELLAHIKEWYDQMFFALEDAGLRGDAGYIGNGYVNHIWDKGKSDPKAWEQYVENYQRTKSPNMKHREVDTYQQGIDVGLVPKFKDIADIIAYYSRSNNEALANKKFLDDLSFMVVEEVNSDGEVVSALPLLSSEKPDPFIEDRYARYHVPGVGDVWVVKDIQKRFANIFGTMRTQDVNKWLETTGKFWDITGSTAKKIELALSGFHALALWEVDVAQNGPVAGLADLFKYIVADSAMKGTLPAYAHPEDFKFAASHLVQLGATEDYAAADVNNITGKLREMVMELYHSDGAFKKAAGAAGTVPAILMDWVNKGFDKVLWNYLHDGLKIASMMRFKRQIDRRAEREGLDDETREKLYDEAGQYVNDMFGGQYWELLNVSPGTLKWMRRLLLSPDWLVSTNRHFFANFGFGSLYGDGGWREYLKYNWDNIRRAAGGKVERDELRRFRSRNAKLCYLIGVLFFWNVLYNALNAWNRKRDQEKQREMAEEMRKTNPDYKSPYELAYPDGMKWYDYLMTGNSLGQQTHLFTGRYEDGTETYVRWGKQFREFPEMFIGRHGLEFPAPLIERMKAKANPNIGGIMDFLGALGVRGFEEGYENRELREKYGRTISVLSATARHFIPFGIPTQADKEYKVMDFFMPSSKGFSRYKTVDYFKTFIIDGDMRGIEQTYQAAVMNGVDAEECLKAAIASVKAEQRKELVDGVKDLTGASERFDAATTYKDRSFWKNKMEQYLGGENHQAMQRAAFMENVQRMLDGESADRTWSVATESYLMHATRDDIIEDYRVRVIAKQVEDMKQELKNMENSDIDETYIEEYRRRPAVRRLMKADKLLGKYKRSKKKTSPGYDALRNKMGGSGDDALMQQIRDTRHQMLSEIDALPLEE